MWSMRRSVFLQLNNRKQTAGAVLTMGQPPVFMFGGEIDLKMVYIASPLRGDYNQNIKNAVEYCRLATESGVLPLAPHIIFSQWCNDSIPEQRKQGLKLGLSLLEKAEELWVMGSRISEGMKGEIAFAKEHGIPTFFIPHPKEPSYYPISANGKRLFTLQDCNEGSTEEDYEGKLVVLRHEQLRAECRTPENQIWLVTHGPGCKPGYVHSDTIHLRHPVDGDCMAVGRADVWGIPKQEALSQFLFDAVQSGQEEENGELCR